MIIIVILLLIIIIITIIIVKTIVLFLKTVFLKGYYFIKVSRKQKEADFLSSEYFIIEIKVVPFKLFEKK